MQRTLLVLYDFVEICCILFPLLLYRAKQTSIIAASCLFFKVDKAKWEGANETLPDVHFFFTIVLLLSF